MKLLAVGVVIAMVGSAHADDRADVEKVVRARLTHLNAYYGRVDYDNANADIREVRHGVDDYPGGSESPIFWRVFQGGLKLVPGTTTVTVVGDAAWYHAVGSLELKSAGVRDARAIRINGIATKQKNGKWLIDAELTAITVDDKALFVEAKARPYKVPAKPTFAGDQALAREVAGWLANKKLAKAAAASGLIASGTSAAEHKTGAATAGLTATWDRIKLVPAEVLARRVGDLAFIHAEVAFVPPKGPPAHLLLGAVVRKDKAGWRWVSLNWSPAEWHPKPQFVDEAAPDDVEENH